MEPRAELRSEPRIECADITVLTTGLPERPHATLWGVVMNISRRGARLLIDEELPRSARVSFVLGERCQLCGTVRHQTRTASGWEIGVAFDPLVHWPDNEHYPRHQFRALQSAQQ